MVHATAEFWDRFSSFYDNNLGSYFYPLHAEDMVLQSGIVSNLDASINVLDIGTGTGQVPMALLKLVPQAEQRLHIHATDISTQMLALLQQKMNKQFPNYKNLQTSVANVLHLQDIASQSIDYLFAGFVLMFINDKDQCYKEVMRVLKPNGVYVEMVFKMSHCSAIFSTWQSMDGVLSGYKYFEKIDLDLMQRGMVTPSLCLQDANLVVPTMQTYASTQLVVSTVHVSLPYDTYVALAWDTMKAMVKQDQYASWKQQVDAVLQQDKPVVLQTCANLFIMKHM